MTKNMQKLLFAFCLGAFILMALPSCKLKNPCDNTICENGGRCLDGTCTCPYGWAGDSCTILVDSCGLYDCGPNASDCLNGTCLCVDGWEGKFCNTRSRDKFMGTFNTAEIRNPGGVNNFLTYLNENDDATRLTLKNFTNIANDTLTMSVVRDSFSIEEQITESNLSVSGNGFINTGRDTVFMTYLIYNNDTGDSIRCTATLVRQ